ncbi:hypothetical protein ACRE0A_05470, partial [Streptococcus pneumoniae]
FYRPEYQKRKDEICPFSSLAFFQPTTVDKEPEKNNFVNKRLLSQLMMSVPARTEILAVDQS